MALVGGILCRLAGVSGELWLDEMWSVLHMEGVSNPIHILTRVHHDNNHPLNSLWIWLNGINASATVLRFPSIVFGFATLATILRWGRLMNERSTASVWAFLVAFSYPLVLTESEARGYALCILCTILCFYHLSAVIKNERASSSAVWFGTWATIGCLTHATFALFLVPVFVWILTGITSPLLRTQRSSFVRYGLLPPLVVGSIVTGLFYSRLQIGGGPVLPYLEVASSTLSVAYGGEALSASNPETTGGALFLTFFLLLVFTSELRAWTKTNDPLAKLVCLVIATPILAVLFTQPHFILSRYFLIPLIFLYVVFARFLIRLTAQGIMGSVTALAIGTGYFIGNASHILELSSLQRSHFIEIFSYITAQSPETPPSVGGTQDFQNEIRLRYSQRVQPGIIHIEYTPKADKREHPAPRFFIGETLDAYEVLPNTFTLRDGISYTAIKSYRAPPLNGSHVTLYERKD